jgi:hypothetical protein
MEISSAAKTLTTLGWFDIRLRLLPTWPSGCCALHLADSAGSQKGPPFIYHYIDSYQCVTSKFLRICPTYTDVTFSSSLGAPKWRYTKPSARSQERLDCCRQSDYSAQIPICHARSDIVISCVSPWRRMRGLRQRKERHSVTLAILIGRRGLPAHHARLSLCRLVARSGGGRIPARARPRRAFLRGR